MFEFWLVVSLLVICSSLMVFLDGWKNWLLTAICLLAFTIVYPHIFGLFMDTTPQNNTESAFDVLFWVSVFFLFAFLFPLDARTTKSGKRDKRYTKQQKEVDNWNAEFSLHTFFTSALSLGGYYLLRYFFF